MQVQQATRTTYRLVTTSGTIAGETHHRARLTEAQVAELLELHRRGLSLAAVASTYGVGKACVWKIIHGHRRGHALVALPTTKPVTSPALTVSPSASEPPQRADPKHHNLSPMQVLTLIELAHAGWTIPRLAERFFLRHSQVRAILAADAAEQRELLPVRRRCSDPLPTLPPRCDEGEDEGGRAMRLLVHALGR